MYDLYLLSSEDQQEYKKKAIAHWRMCWDRESPKDYAYIRDYGTFEGYVNAKIDENTQVFVMAALNSEQREHFGLSVREAEQLVADENQYFAKGVVFWQEFKKEFNLP